MFSVCLHDFSLGFNSPKSKIQNLFAVMGTVLSWTLPPHQPIISNFSTIYLNMWMQESKFLQQSFPDFSTICFSCFVSTSLPISFLFFTFPNLTSLLFSLYGRSRWMLRGFGCCSCRRGRPPPAPRPLGPGRLSTRFAFAPTGGSSCPRLAPDPPARSATTSASRTHTYKNK